MANAFTAEAKVNYSENFRRFGKINFILASVLKKKNKKKKKKNKKTSFILMDVYCSI